MPLILLIVGLVLIIYNYRAIKRESKVKKEDNILNISFQSVLQDSKEELNDYKMEIGILRKDIAESLTELQEEIIDIKNNLNKLKNNEEIYDNKQDLENKYSINEDEIDTKMNNDYSKTNKINKIDQIIGNTGENLVVDSDINEEKTTEVIFSEKVDSNKTQSIKKLLKEGLTEEQICHELSVSKGEVLLVKGLFKK
ncbi:hypothetical protein DIC82_07975 [Clostridium beijerinckii]|nr:hypothetical protein DIC82_07975 [Clostridium beijerinckii]